MKHARTISRVNVRPAQDMPAGDIITIIVAVLTAFGAIVDALGPLFEDKQK